MQLIIDTNIFISVLITPKGKTANLLFNQLHNSHIFAPDFLLTELMDKQHKICKLTGYTPSEFNELVFLLLKRLQLINLSIVDVKCIDEAKQLVANIDPKDYSFVALSLHLNCAIWSGDNKLIEGLHKKKFANIFNAEKLKEKLGIS